MLRLIVECIALAGYLVAGGYHIKDLANVPIPLVGVSWVVAFRLIPPIVPNIALFWVTYALFVYQLISFHDLDACFLDKCETTIVYNCIMVASTAILWFSMRESSPKKSEIKTVKKMTPKPARLVIGDTYQPKWV